MMREIKREYTITTYTVLEFKDGKMEEIGSVILEGEKDVIKARKAAMKQYPNKNICLGEWKIETAVYSMSAQDFIKQAHKEIIKKGEIKQ